MINYIYEEEYISLFDLLLAIQGSQKCHRRVRFLCDF